MNSPIIKSRNVRLEPTRPGARRRESARGTCATPGEKRVRLLEENGLVSAIELVCGCGEVTVVELEYAQSNDSSGTPS